eukprot:TRINITY_DN4761_c0_g2_i8.p1 TRINITY_DN4761_c0_g2~~TRINITY_DN4761_c0_g2_i8.p1  ORF type:complete len:448 (+),score=80.20 TRINITY_DN4761_c0_g2_i8:78-1421(+)
MDRRSINIAVVGCTHGQLDEIYQSINEIEEKQKKKVDLVLCCGDFEAVRNEHDLSCLSGPTKYHVFKDYHKYYTGVCRAPVPTIFVGGNHEAVNHLKELYYGGWVAPNIYFLGYSGVVNFGGLRIAGFSGIYKPYDFQKGHYEAEPYDDNSRRSAFHVRKFELFKLKQVLSPIDIFMSHDWPKEVVTRDSEISEHILQQVKDGSFGCIQYTELLKIHKPRWWLSGHMHTNFQTEFEHSDGSSTKFLARTKVDYSDYLGFISVLPTRPGAMEISYDLEWLGILKTFSELIPRTNTTVQLPKKMDSRKLNSNIRWVENNILDLRVPTNFEITVRPHLPVPPSAEFFKRIQNLDDSCPTNPQTTVFVNKLDIPVPFPQIQEPEKRQSFSSTTKQPEVAEERAPRGFEEPPTRTTLKQKSRPDQPENESTTTKSTNSQTVAKKRRVQGNGW